MGVGPYRRRQVLGDPMGIRLDGWRQRENHCRELPAHDQRRCPRGRPDHGGSKNGSWQAFQIWFVLEARHPAADLVEDPFAFFGKIDHEHHGEVLQLLPMEICRAANKECAKFCETSPIIIVIVHSDSSVLSWCRLPFH